MTVVNALSDYFMLESLREQEKTDHIIEFEDGYLKNDKRKSNQSGKHGTKVKFKSNPKYMGNDCTLPVEDMVKWVETVFCLDSEKLNKKGISCKFLIYDGMTLKETHKIKPSPFKSLIDKILPEGFGKRDFSSQMMISGDKEFVEKSKTLVEKKDGTKIVEIVPTQKHIHMDVCLQYAVNPELNDPATYDTYCNYTNTVKNGVHLKAFEEAFCRFMYGAVNETMSDSQKDKMKISWDDIRNNLYCIINLSSNAAVGFVGNAKEEIGNEALIPHMKELLNKKIKKFFNENPSVLNEYIKIIKLNAKARIEANKIKSASQTERLNTFKEHELKNYIRCNNTGKQWKELFILEGDSASGSARNACNPDTQAIFLLKGVVFNAVKSDNFADAMANNEWKQLVNVLKCGAGPNFNMDKLYFNRINIMTDADVDGEFITAGILAFFYWYLRPIIEAGKLYKVYSPLYALDDPEDKYATNKAGLAKIYHKKIIKSYKIKLHGHSDWFDKDEFKVFLQDVYDYRSNLIRAAEQSGDINKFLIEIIGALLTIDGYVKSPYDFTDPKKLFSDQKVVTKMMNTIQKKFREITVSSNGVFSGPINNTMTSIKVGSRFYHKISDLIPIFKKYGYLLDVKEKDKDPVVMTIGEFLDYTQKLYPVITSRFKGLSEANANQLRETTMDINHRYSVQYTVDDVEKELASFYVTHGGSKQNAADRKELISNYKISRDDLDN